MEGPIDLQKLVYFTEGNTFTGSRSREGRAPFRYRVTPDRGENRLLAAAWCRDVCYELAGDACQTRDFPMTEDGLEALGKWLAACCEAADDTEEGSGQHV